MDSHVSPRFPPWLAPAILVVVVWLSLATLFTIQPIASGAMEWSEAIPFAFPFWMIWILAAPLAVGLAFLLPIERGRILISLSAHLIACAAVIAVNQSVIRQNSPPANSLAPGRLTPRPGGPPWLRGNNPPNPPDSPSPEIPSRPRGGGLRRGGPGGPPAARLVLDLITYTMIVSVGQAVSWSRRARERERRALIAEARLAQARLAALQMQLNPHFLFNALNSISTLIHTDPKAADTMLGDLSELLRAALDTASQHEVSVRRETEFLTNYLSIEKTRFGDRLTVEQSIAPETWDALVPTLILQPLIENAIKHGVERKRGPGTVRTAIARKQERLVLTVEDTGVGYHPQHPSSDGHGIGLSNTRSRLEQLYGSDYLLDVRTGSQGGCIVTVEIPFHTQALKIADPDRLTST